MSSLKCVVEGCDLEYDVICSFSFYNLNTGTEDVRVRQDWIDGAMKEDSECLWRHVSLQLCGYHFELDSQGLWIDSPMLPELLTLQKQAPKLEPTEENKKVAEIIRIEHNYNAIEPEPEPCSISRLNVRQLVDTLGYLSLKNLQRKQLWVAKVETDKVEASITQAEQVITKMQDKQVIQIIPQQRVEQSSTSQAGDELQMIDNSISDNYICEIAEEQEIAMEEVKEIEERDWVLNIVHEDKPKYAFVKQTSLGNKKRHFTAEMNEITLHGDFDNYYILPDADTSVGVEVTTTNYEPETYIVQDCSQLTIEERPKKRSIQGTSDLGKKKKKRLSSTSIPTTSIKEEAKHINEDLVESDWIIENNVAYDQDGHEDYDEKKIRARRKNKKYLGYDFVT